MKRHIIVVLLVAAAVAVGQTGEQVRRELEETDRMIRDAESFIMASENGQARDMYEGAKEAQRNAWAHFNQRQYVRAAGRTREARLKLVQALELAKFNPDKVAAEVRRTQELVDELRPLVIRSRIRKAIELGRIAEGEQEGARREFEARRYGIALRFTRAARRHAREAALIVWRQGGQERLERELRRTDDMLRKARERVHLSQDDRVPDMLQRAEEWQRQAMEAFRAGEPLRALKMTMEARDLLMRAWVRARGDADPEAVEEELAEVERLRAEWQAEIRASGNDEATGLLDRALEQRDRARERLGRQETRAALQEATLARRLLSRAIEMVQSEETAPGPEGPGPDQD